MGYMEGVEHLSLEGPATETFAEAVKRNDALRGLPKEQDPDGIPAGQPGAKLDAGKSPVYQGVLDYFPRAVMAVASLSMYGATKYSWKGWEKVKDGINRYKNAEGRHTVKQAIEGLWDQEVIHDPKFPACILHQTQVAWNAMATLELMLREHPEYMDTKTCR